MYENIIINPTKKKKKEMLNIHRIVIYTLIDHDDIALWSLVPVSNYKINVLDFLLLSLSLFLSSMF